MNVCRRFPRGSVEPAYAGVLPDGLNILCRYPPRIDETLENLDAGLVALRPLEIGTMLEDDENILSGVAKVDEVGSDDERNINSTDAATRSITTELDSKMDNILNTQREVMEKEESELLRQDVQHSIQSGDEEVDEDEEVCITICCSLNAFLILCILFCAYFHFSLSIHILFTDSICTRVMMTWMK